jgi:uncharacterized tellurite resistance protein B-like protein
MAVNWDDVRFRGDARDVKELMDTYRVDDYIDAFEENLKQLDRSIRDKLMKDGIRLTERVSPRIYCIFASVCEALGLDTRVEIFCLPSPEINAFAILDVSHAGSRSLVGITSAALERLEDGELKSILGHEFAHVLFGNNRLMALGRTDKDNPDITVLPAFGESLFLRWLKKAEISADRAGLLACRNLRDATTSLLKATFGLSERNLNLDIEALISQVDEIKGHPELMEETFSTHPLLPIRLKALELFSRSEKAKRNGFPATGPLLNDEEMESAVEELVRLTRRYPYQPLHVAIMKLIARAGALLLSADGDVSDDEVKILVHILHRWFTDEPEEEILTDREAIMQSLPEALEIVKKEGDGEDKAFVLSRLTEIALADGALMDVESAVILDVAQHLDVPVKMAYRVMMHAAQAVGFRTDVKLNRMAEKLKRELQVGFVPEP